MTKITADMYDKLKAPLPAEAVKPHPTKTYLSSIKAIYVTERLNDVFGCGAWHIKTDVISENPKGMVVVKTILTIPEYDVYYESFGGNDNGGENSKNFDLGDAYKGATTDGITKIGSYLGIGLSVFQGKGNHPGNNAPQTNETPGEGKVYAPSKSDEIIAQMDISTDMEELKALYTELLTHTKSAKQTAFFDSVKEKNKKRISTLNIHTA